jgi:hypothetical protein
MNAIVYIPLLALAWALGFLLAILAAHYFLVVIDSSASGYEKIAWPDEGLTDFFWKVFYLAWLAGIWMAPFIIVSRLISHDALWRFAIVAGSFWLFLPIGMLSSLSAHSPWMPFWPGLFSRMSQRPQATVSFYLLSIPISVVLVGAFHAIMMREDTAMAQCLFLAPLAAAAYLIYARTLGRLGLVLTFTKGGENERPKKKKKTKKPAENIPAAGEHTEQPIYKQPSELPPIDTPFEGPVTGYNVQFDNRLPPADVAPAARRPLIDDDEDLTPLTMEAGEPDPVTEKKPPPPPPPSAEEMALWDTTKRVKEPKQPWDSSLVAFLFEEKTLQRWLILAVGLAILGGLCTALRELRPMEKEKESEKTTAARLAPRGGAPLPNGRNWGYSNCISVNSDGPADSLPF